jgi:uncharacterized membrane protein YccC
MKHGDSGKPASKAFWASVLRYEPQKINPWMGLRNAVGVAAPIAIGAALHNLPSGIWAAMGAWNVAFTDSAVPYALRARRMLAASALVGIGVFAGAVCGNEPGIRLLVATGWAFVAGMLVALDQAAADVGTLSLVNLLVFAGLPMARQQAEAAGALAFFGGLLQTALSVASWPLTRYAPERRALADFFYALAETASGSTRATEPPPATAQSTNAQETLASLDRSIEAERYRALLSQAERMRLGLLVLARVRARIQRENPECPALPIIARFFDESASVLEALGEELSGGRQALPANETRPLVDAMRDCPGPTVRDARRQMDALAGQFRAALDLAAGSEPEGAARFERREAARSWRLRLQGTIATLSANLSLQSAAFRHAVRLAVCVAIGEALAQTLGLTRSYWAPMTIAIVLKPDFSGTFGRGLLRLAGTFAGLMVATGLLHVMPEGAGLAILLLGLSVFAVRAFGPANYGIAATGITAMVVILMGLSGIAPGSVILPRAINTTIGGAVALCAYAIWPTWERTQLAETIARLLDAYREYIHEVRFAYENPDSPAPPALDRARVAGRRARSNLEASVERLSAEPGTPRERMRVLGGLLANSHRLIHAVMALEAGLSASRAAAARPQFRAFAGDVEIVLERLAAALRGARLDPEDLPDLREDHDTLLRTGDPENARYALVNVETDRIANSLNTLAEDVVQWTCAC